VSCTYVRAVALVLLLCASGLRAGAQTIQTPSDPADTARVHVGPLSLNPRIELLNVGVDSNILDEADAPREDFTATLRPSLDATLRFGRGRLTYRSWMDVVYFQKYKDERSLNRFGDVRLEARLTRFVPYATVSGLVTRERPNREIDLRARRENQTLGAGAALLMFSRTSLIGAVKRETIRYASSEVFRGESLSQQLDETRSVFQGGLRFALTPLTSLAVTASREEDRFDLSPDRDADSLRIAPALEFDPSALVSGSVSVGYRRFSPLHGTMPRFRGLVAQVNTRYTMLGRTRFDLQFARDIDYSYESELPYYLRTGGTLTVTQLLAGPVDVQAMAGGDQLEYRSSVAEDTGMVGTDTTGTAGGGIGYRLGQTARVGINVDFTRRRGHVPDRSFYRRRIFASVTYGF
jgi:hypothetical protein